MAQTKLEDADSLDGGTKIFSFFPLSTFYNYSSNNRCCSSSLKTYTRYRNSTAYGTHRLVDTPSETLSQTTRRIKKTREAETTNQARRPEPAGHVKTALAQGRLSFRSPQKGHQLEMGIQATELQRGLDTDLVVSKGRAG